MEMVKASVVDKSIPSSEAILPPNFPLTWNCGSFLYFDKNVHFSASLITSMGYMAPEKNMLARYRP